MLQAQAHSHMIKIMSDDLLALFTRSPVMHLLAGETLFLTGQSVHRLFLVVEGQVQLRRHTPQGEALVLQNATSNTIVAEASAYSDQYHCDAVAVTPSTVAPIDKTVFLKAMDDTPSLAKQWACHLARCVQAARVRAEIRARPTVSARLQAWLDEGNALPTKGHWHELAAELSVTREALYRELAKRR